MKFCPYEKGTSFSHAEGGHNKFLGSFLAILKWVRKKFPLFKRGRAKSFTLS